MPATYMSYLFTPDDTVEDKRQKLYLGVISAGEQAYTLGAALAECRKQLTALDHIVDTLRKQFAEFKEAERGEGT